MNLKPAPVVYTVSEVAAMLNVSGASIRHWMKTKSEWAAAVHRFGTAVRLEVEQIHRPVEEGGCGVPAPRAF